VDGQFTSEEQSPLAHSQDPKRRAGGKLLFADSAAVIANFKNQVAILAGKT